MAEEYIKRTNVVSALWKALYSYEDKTEKQFKEDPNLEIGEWFDHRIFVQACHSECLGEILVIPSADVAEVVHGEWIEQEDGFGDTYYDCSCCGESFCLIEGTPTDNMYNFCPNCGARMDGGA